MSLLAAVDETVLASDMQSSLRGSAQTALGTGRLADTVDVSILQTSSVTLAGVSDANAEPVREALERDICGDNGPESCRVTRTSRRRLVTRASAASDAPPSPPIDLGGDSGGDLGTTSDVTLEIFRELRGSDTLAAPTVDVNVLATANGGLAPTVQQAVAVTDMVAYVVAVVIGEDAVTYENALSAELPEGAANSSGRSAGEFTVTVGGVPSPPAPPRSSPPPLPPPPRGSDDAVSSTDSNVSSSNSDIGGIVGGAVGGVVVLSGLVALGLCAFKRSQDKKKKAQPTLTSKLAQKQPVEAEGSQVTITRTITISQGGDKQAAGPSEMPVATPAPPTEMPVASPQSMAALLAACGLEQHTSAFEAESYTLESLLVAMKQGDDAAMRDLRALKLNLGECRKLIQAATETRPASGSLDVAVHHV